MFKLVAIAGLVALATGNENLKFDPKVINGQNAKLGEFPHQVSIHKKSILSSSHYCGGSIISPSTVLTAGHCVKNAFLIPGQERVVMAGFISQKDPGAGLQKRKVKKTIVHPGFKGGVATSDLAIHILDHPFTFNENVAAIALPQSGNSSEVEGIVTVSGWGSTSTTEKPTYPDILQKADLITIPFDECFAALGKPLDQTMMCTGSREGGEGACSGDSGGPLIQDGTLVGVVSWGTFPCGGEGKPSVYTKTSSHLKWINENIV